MYYFRLYYSVKGSNRRRTKTIRGDACSLGNAWERALNCAIVLTENDEILNSIQILEEEQRC